MWYVVCGMWYVVCGMWYVVCGMCEQRKHLRLLLQMDRKLSHRHHGTSTNRPLSQQNDAVFTPKVLRAHCTRNMCSMSGAIRYKSPVVILVDVFSPSFDNAS